MYVHAVQSLIFNKLASEEGFWNPKHELLLAKLRSRALWKPFFERLKNGGSKLLVGDLVQPDENDNKTVTVVTEENQDQFTLWDIVMTLPGYDVEYSGMVSSGLEILKWTSQLGTPKKEITILLSGLTDVKRPVHDSDSIHSKGPFCRLAGHFQDHPLSIWKHYIWIKNLSAANQ